MTNNIEDAKFSDAEWDLRVEVQQLRTLVQAWHVGWLCRECKESYTDEPCNDNHQFVRELIYPDEVRNRKVATKELGR
jgi:hypothetical protein